MFWDSFILTLSSTIVAHRKLKLLKVEFKIVDQNFSF